MHWRGDRTAGEFIEDPRALDSDLAFKAFNVAFDSLLGRDEGELSEADMDAFADFILQIAPPPNPVRALNNQLTAAQAEGRRIFLDDQLLADDAAHCGGCHTLSPLRGEFGTLGQTTFDDEPQEFKVPQLKNMYQKIGMFGTPHTHFADIRPEHAAFQGDQIRGFGFLHDGSTATVFDFLRAVFFHIDDTQRRALEQYMFAFDTTFAPIVGQQVTLTDGNGTSAGPRIDLLIARAETRFVLVDQPNARECELVAKAVVDGVPRGYLYDPDGRVFRSDRAAETAISDGALRALASVPGQPVTFTCAPPSEGRRLGIDRDVDGHFDRDEIDAGTDPADPESFPGGPVDVRVALAALQITNRLPEDEARNKVVLVASGPGIATPPVGGPDDPRCGLSPPSTVRATLRIASDGSGQVHETDLPCGNWRLIGTAADPGNRSATASSTTARRSWWCGRPAAG